MFKNLGLHIVKHPSGRWGFVGSIPAELGAPVPASTAAVMGGRAYRAADGQLVEHKFPTFATEAEARQHVETAFIAAGNAGANADVNHPQRKAWEAMRAVVFAQR